MALNFAQQITFDHVFNINRKVMIESKPIENENISNGKDDDIIELVINDEGVYVNDK